MSSGYTYNAESVYQMGWSVYFIIGISVASIAWGVINYFIIKTIEYEEKPIVELLRNDKGSDEEA
jgi:hypothetical protein